MSLATTQYMINNVLMNIVVNLVDKKPTVNHKDLYNVAVSDSDFFLFRTLHEYCGVCNT